MNALYRDILNTGEYRVVIFRIKFSLELTYMYIEYTVFQSNDLHVINWACFMFDLTPVLQLDLFCSI